MQVLWELFSSFFVIGAFSIGGGYAMTQAFLDATLRYGWTDVATFNAGAGISSMSPGPFAVNVATFLGIKAAGVPGAIAAVLGMICPSVIIITLIARFFYSFQENHVVVGVLAGIRPLVIGLIASAVYSLGKAPFTTTMGTRVGIPGNWVAIAIAVVMGFGIRKYKLHPVLCVAVSAVLGIICFTG